VAEQGARRRSDMAPETSGGHRGLGATPELELRAIERNAREQLAEMRRLLEAAQAQQFRFIADFKQAYEAERERRRQLHEAYLATIKVLAAAIGARDGYTGGHVERVRACSHILGRSLGLDPDALQQLDVGAILHDVGTLAVPDRVLTKPGPLDDEEWRVLAQHPMIGANLLRQVPALAAASMIVMSHHERWDGAGYPLGLQADAIPLGGRIVAVADAFDSMTTDRAYRGRRNVEEAVAEIERSSGSHFDPAVAEIFVQAWKSGAIT